ncbi:MAG TPA: CocE/NonD family hydrolase [Iamia sp.]|nr:CocE/NonD family hydrolase [Iamia sp.]
MRRLLLVLALALAAVGCSDDGDDAEATDGTTTTAAEAPTTTDAVAPLDTYAVAETRATWVDDTRPTPAHGGQPELPERTLDVVIYAPEDEPGPWPLIVFGHGSSRAGDHYAATLRAWASAGYVVVAPDFPLSSEGTPGGTKYDEVENQTADVSFLIDTAVAELDAVDPERIGVGGQSFGAMTALGVGFNACCADPRIDVVTEFAGIWFPLSSTEQDPSTTDRPLLMVHGGDDHSLTSVEQARSDWEEVIDAPGGFITLIGAEHDDGYYDGPVDARGTVVTEAVLAFYDAHLKDDPTGWDRVRAAVEEAGPEVATLVER